ncbi:MAG: hypothetical protein ACRERX_22650 [Pseudomonas sp.]
MRPDRHHQDRPENRYRLSDGASVTAENIELEGARRTELLEVTEIAAGQQRLDVCLKAEVRREDPVDTRIQRKRPGRECGKDVPAPERCVGDRVRYGLNVLGSAASPTVGRFEAKLDVAGGLEPGHQPNEISAPAGGIPLIGQCGADVVGAPAVTGVLQPEVV